MLNVVWCSLCRKSSIAITITFVTTIFFLLPHVYCAIIIIMIFVGLVGIPEFKWRKNPPFPHPTKKSVDTKKLRAHWKRILKCGFRSIYFPCLTCRKCLIWFDFLSSILLLLLSLCGRRELWIKCPAEMWSWGLFFSLFFFLGGGVLLRRLFLHFVTFSIMELKIGLLVCVCVCECVYLCEDWLELYYTN